MRHAVAQGVHGVPDFLAQSRAPAIPTAWTVPSWSDYLDDAVLQALRVASDITKQPQVNALGLLPWAAPCWHRRWPWPKRAASIPWLR